MERIGALRVRVHGTSGPTVIVLHGGPAAAGEAAGLARGLAGDFRVLEPWQRGSGAEPLTVARHVADLHALIEARCCGRRPALVGESWGAMLALAYAAEHPGAAGPLALVSCGTFDPLSRERFRQVLEERAGGGLRERMADLEREYPDPERRMRAWGAFLDRVYSHDLLPDDTDPKPADSFDLRAHEETWNDMLRLQATGVYPAAFAAIRSPVLMLHGACDPHPGPMIRDSLRPFLPQLEYHEWERCGHYPWRECEVREGFFAVLRAWLRQHGGEGSI